MKIFTDRNFVFESQPATLGTVYLLMLGAITKRIVPTLSVLSRPMSVAVRGSKFKLALVQLAVTADKEHNLKHARTKVLEASANGANVVVLPVKSKQKPVRLSNQTILSLLIRGNVGVLQLSLRNELFP
jgi:hypothetical protein